MKLDTFPKPPKAIYHLWYADTPEGLLFREHARSINNAVCLTSIKVKQRNFDRFSPSVIFEGKVQKLAGPLEAAPGEKPCFSQLYILDPILQSGIRFSNMTVPESMSKSQKIVMKNILKTVEDTLLQCNPFVKDFKQVMEIPEEEIGNGMIIISAKARPNGEHAR